MWILHSVTIDACSVLCKATGFPFELFCSLGRTFPLCWAHSAQPPFQASAVTLGYQNCFMQCTNAHRGTCWEAEVRLTNIVLEIPKSTVI